MYHQYFFMALVNHCGFSIIVKKYFNLSDINFATQKQKFSCL